MSSPMSSDRAQLIERLRKKHAEPYSVCPYTRSGCESEEGILISGAERDALLAALGAEAEPRGTCATCKFWCAGKSQGEDMRESYIRNGWDGECGRAEAIRKMFTIYVYGDGRVDDYEFDTPSDFYCKFHEPSPPPSVRERENEK